MRRLSAPLRQGFGRLAPPLSVGTRELWLGSVGTGLALLLSEWLSRLMLGAAAPWFIAPMGASAVLLFAMPASPLAQPWPLVAGNLLSAAIGVACFQGLGAGGGAAALALTLALLAMFALRCLHPPAGAVAVTAVLGGPSIQQLGWGFAAGPVLVNTLLLLVLAVVFNNAVRRRYPHAPAAQDPLHATRDPLPSTRLGTTQADFDQALASYGEVLDIGPGDLEEIMVRAQLNAARRRWGEVRCRDIMSRDVVTITPEASVDEAWARLARHRIKALPVVDGTRRLVGILSLHDFFLRQGSERLTRVPVMRPAHRVEEIMTRQVRVARPGQELAGLVNSFSDGGLHHLPVVDDEGRLVGMITQSDLVAALFTSASEAAVHDGQAARRRSQPPARPRAAA